MGKVSKYHPAKTFFPNPDLVTEISELTGLSKHKVELTIKAMAQSMKASLLRKEPIEIRGFGSFILKQWKSHRHIFQFTNKGHFIVPERTRVRFIIARELSDMINQKEPNGNS